VTAPVVRYRPIGRHEAFWLGVLAALDFTALMFAARIALDAPALPELFVDLVTRLMPGPVFSALLDALGGNAKRLLFYALLAGQLGAGGLLGMLYYRVWQPPKTSQVVWPPPTPVRWGLSGGLVYATAIWLVLMAAVLPLVGKGFFGADVVTSVSYPLVTWLEILTFGYALFAFDELKDRMGLNPRPPGPLFAGVDEPAGSRGRRRMLAAMVWGAATVTAGAILGFLLSQYETIATYTDTSRRRSDGLLPEVTPVAGFYHVSKNIVDPTVNVAAWALAVGGLVEAPFTLRYADLTSLPAVQQYTTLQCISNGVGGDLMGNAEWKGVPLRALLEQARLKPGVVKIVFKCADGYADSIPLAKALAPETLVVYEMNGEPLTPPHGFPTRIIVPGLYGMKNAKWVTAIHAVDTDFQGYWQEQGWSDVARYQTAARIDTPNRGATIAPSLDATLVGGVAFAGDRGISRVEVSFDSGVTWQPAGLKPPLGKFTWVQWTATWNPTKAGDYYLKVRATDGAGALQTAGQSDPFPNGATGYHWIRVEVAAAAS